MFSHACVHHSPHTCELPNNRNPAQAVLKLKASAFRAWDDSWAIEEHFWGTFMDEEAAQKVLLDKCFARLPTKDLYLCVVF